ncbi:MAG TPA: NAD-dependent epimerase, partial [Flavobacteriales bacterium]|nr:NAD-dependent epimerase [Flavobacteriales bacterium]
MARTLVIGAAGQLGIEMVLALQAQEGITNVDISDIRVPDNDAVMKSRFLHMDATDEGAVFKTLEEGKYDTVYHLAAM